MRYTTRLICLFLLFTALSVPNESPAQGNGQEALPVPADSVTRLAEAVENLNRLLERQVSTQTESKDLRKLDIAISYLNFRSRRIEMMERDLTIIKNERSRLEDTIQHWRERQELLSRQMEGLSDEEKQVLQRERQELVTREKNFAQRLVRLEEEAIEQQNRIYELQDQLDSVESYVQQHLDM